MLAMASKRKVVICLGLLVATLLVATLLVVAIGHRVQCRKLERKQLSESVIAIVDERADELVAIEVTDWQEGKRAIHRIAVRETSFPKLVEILGQPDFLQFDKNDSSGKAFGAEYKVGGIHTHFYFSRGREYPLDSIQVFLMD